MKQFEWCGDKYVILDKKNFDFHLKAGVLSLFFKVNEEVYRYIGCVINPVIKFSPSGRIARINDINIGGNVVLTHEVEE